MNAIARLSTFIFLSLLLHLLVVQIELEKQGNLKQSSQQGVQVVNRPAGQFMLTESLEVPSVLQKSSVPRTVKSAPSTPIFEKKTETAVVETPSRELSVAKEIVKQANGGQEKKRIESKAFSNPTPKNIEKLDKEVKSQSETLSKWDEPTDLTIEGDRNIDVSGSEKLLDGNEGGDGVADVVESFYQALPRYDINPLPKYPEVARRRGRQGTVKFEVQVLATGQVGEIKMVESSGYRSLDLAAKKAVKYWQFNPATSYSVPIESRVIVPIDFVLN